MAIRRLTKLRTPTCALDLVRLAGDLTSLRTAMAQVSSFSNAWPQEVAGVVTALNNSVEDADDAITMGGTMIDAAAGVLGVVAGGSDVAMLSNFTLLKSLCDELPPLEDIYNLLERMVANVNAAILTYSDAPYPASDQIQKASYKAG